MRTPSNHYAAVPAERLPRCAATTGTPQAVQAGGRAVTSRSQHSGRDWLADALCSIQPESGKR